MTEFVEQSDAPSTEPLSAEEIEADIKYKRLVRADKRKYDFQLVVAHLMRLEAIAVVDDIPDTIRPTTLIVISSHQEPVDLVTGETRTKFTPKEEISAFCVAPRFQTALDKSGGMPRRLFYSPIFLARNGNLLTVPDHTISISNYGGDEQELSLEESVARHRASYRELLRGAELPSMATINNANRNDYSLFYPIERPRPTTDDDLIDPIKTGVSRLWGKNPVVLSEWRKNLSEMIE
jgi:hypothetical protein